MNRPIPAETCEMCAYWCRGLNASPSTSHCDYAAVEKKSKLRVLYELTGVAELPNTEECPFFKRKEENWDER